MSARGDLGDAISILSFDSGGPGTYSQLLILKEYTGRLASDLGISEDEVYPADYFDLMGGVGFGGLVAFILGHLRMNVNEAIDTLLDVASAIFPAEPQQTPDLEMNTNNLKEAIEAVLQRREVPLKTKMNDPNYPPTSCKVVLYAAPSARLNHPQPFRTYPSRGSSLNPTIVEAICATMSTPSHFSPVKIGPRLVQQSFVGGPLGANNPTRELLKEANGVFGKDRRVAQILSLGSGLSHVLSLESSTKEAGLNQLVNKLAADCETVAQELHARLYNVPAYLRLNVDRGMENVVMEDWSGLGDIASHTGAYVAVPSVSESLDTSLRFLRGRVGSVTLGQLNQSSSIKILAKTAPAVSPHFVPRSKPWTHMVRHLITSPSSRQRIFPITGMGGCGKTQMVSYFLQEHPSMYTKVAYIDASSYASIQSDLQAWSQAAEDGHERDTWEDAFKLLASVPPDERWLLILDNADDPTLNLVRFLPKNRNLTVIITSRNRDVGDISTTSHLELGEMEEDEAMATLLQAARRQAPLSDKELKSAKALVKALGYLAVALVQAGTYCHQLSSEVHGVFQPYTFTQYLSLFYTHRAEMMKKAPPSSLDEYQRGVYTTLDLSYQAIPQASREFLHFLSFFHHTDIPLAAFASTAKRGFQDRRTFLERPASHLGTVSELNTLLCADGMWNELHVQEMIRTLRSFSLLSATSIQDSTFLQLHPLVQAWSRDMVPSASQHYRAMVMQSLTPCGYDEMFPLFRHILPHILDILGQVEMEDLHVNDLMAVGVILKVQGHYQKAAEVVETALEKMPSEDQQFTIGAMEVTFFLAQIYSAGGKWNEAEKLRVQVLEQRRRLLGVEHPDTVLAAGDLALTYWHQGRHHEAEKLDLEVVDQRRKTLGVEHPHTIIAMANLASTYSRQGRHGEAETLQLEVLELQKRVLGLEHPDTFGAMANLASTYWGQGQYGEAETLELEVLELRRRVLGLEHPDTIRAMANLASTYWGQGRHGEAETLQLEVLELQRRVLELEHPDTITAMANLASTYWGQGRHGEAETLQLEVLELQKRVLGLEHPDIIRAMANLASTYSGQGRHGEAETLELEVLELRRRVLGLEHPDTFGAMANLASTYWGQGRHGEAETLELEVLELRRRVLGLEHPDTIRAMANLASTYSRQGRHGEAETLQLEVLELRRRVLGLEHPDTIRAMANLASTYWGQGQYGEAETLQLEVLELRRRVLGLEHPDTILASANLAVTYAYQSRWNEAAELLAVAVTLGLKVLGQQHPDTQDDIRTLGDVYERLGKTKEAEETRKLLLS